MATKRVSFDVLAFAHAQGFDKTGREIKRFADDSKVHVGNLTTAIATVGPALVPIVAAAAVAGAGLGALGAVGVLAVLGINRQMKAGTPLGEKYTTMVGTLQGNLHTLEKTAAKGVLTGFQTAVAKLQPLMPTLNNDTRILAGKLGVIVSHVAPALVKLFIALNPLLLSFADYLVTGAKKLDDWSGSAGGVKDFVAYAQEQLPKVGKFLRDVGTAVGRIVVGLAPLGGLSLSTIGAFARLVSVIPLDVLKILAPTITGIIVATKLWNIAQIALNNSMKKNVFLFIAAALIALGVWFVTTYKHSQDFRDKVRGVIKNLEHAWDNFTHALGNVKHAWDNVWHAGQNVVNFFKAAYLDIKIVALNIGIAFIQYVEIPVLDVFSAIVHGAAAAFGWVPGIGPKLKNAAGKFDDFRSHVDAKLHGLQVQLHTAQAKRNLHNFKVQLVALKDKSISINTYVRRVILPTITRRAEHGGYYNPLAHAAGGMTLAPHLAMVGDNRSKNELIAPMGDPRTVDMLSAALAKAGAGGSGTPVIINLNGAVLGSTDQVTRDIVKGLEQAAARGAKFHIAKAVT